MAYIITLDVGVQVSDYNTCVMTSGTGFTADVV